MTIGTATVASVKVRRTGDRSASQSPKARLSTVSVGKTASQIINASWCLVGGPTGAGRVVLGMRDIGSPWVPEVVGRGVVRVARPGGFTATYGLPRGRRRRRGRR